MKRSTRLVALVAIVSTAALAAPKEKPPQDTVLLENGPAKVTVKDFDASMTRFPENLRQEAAAYPGVIMKNLDAIFVNRIAAQRAHEAKLDQDPLVQQRLQQIQEAYLAQKYLDHLYDQVKVPDLTLRAEEIYKSEPKRWVVPPTAALDDIIINFVGRTPEMALARGREAEKRIRAGEDFLAVAAEYTDDKNFKKSKGDLGISRLTDLEEPLRVAVEATKAGDITPATRSGPAVHILRVREKYPAMQRSFAEVKSQIMAEEDERIRRKATDDFLMQVRNDPKNLIHVDRVEALRTDIDFSKIDAARAKAIEQVEGRTQPQVK